MSKVAIVTGASRGIGAEISKMLARDNIIVVALYNKSFDKANNLKEELNKESFKLDLVQADVSKKEECQKVIDYTIDKYGKIDILINNAGIDQCKLFIDITDEEWKEMIDTNLNSVFYMTQGAVKNMISNKKGCIINISSIWGMVGASCEVAYSVTKAGIDGMTKALAKELGPSNIRVNSIAPGIIDTDMNKNLSKEDIEEIKKQIPLERVGTTLDIAKCVKWLVEDEYTTGQIISPNGGWVIN